MVPSVVQRHTRINLGVPQRMTLRVLESWGCLVIKVFVLIIGIATCLGAGWGYAEPPKKEVQEWRVLLIIKPETALDLKDHSPVKSRMSADNIDAVKKAFVEHTAYWVTKISEGRLLWKPKAVISPTPVTAVTEMGKNSYWLAPSNIPEDIQNFVPAGAYDGVFVYWKAVDEQGKGIDAGFGWSIGPNQNANNCGYSCVHYGETNLWDRDSEPTEIFVHEWLHQLEAFYGSKGVKLPKGGLHVDASYGYTHHPTMYWKPWYRDFIAGEVREPDGSKTGFAMAQEWRIPAEANGALIGLLDFHFVADVSGVGMVRFLITR